MTDGLCDILFSFLQGGFSKTETEKHDVYDCRQVVFFLFKAGNHLAA